MLKKIDMYFEEIILVFLLVCMSIVLALQIMSRYVFHSSLSWSEELVRYMLVWSAFIGVPYCIKNKTSIKIDQFKIKLPYYLQIKLSYITDGILFILFFVLMIFSADIVTSSFGSGQTSAAMSIPSWLIQMSVPLGSAVSLVRIGQNVYDRYKRQEV